MSVADDTRLSALDDVLDAALAPHRDGVLGRIADAVAGPPAAPEPGSVSADLFGVVDAFDSSASLRRLLTSSKV